MTRLCIIALCALFIAPAIAQDKKSTGLRYATMPASFSKAQDALRTVTVAEVNSLQEDDLIEIEELCRHWLRVLADERARRKK